MSLSRLSVMSFITLCAITSPVCAKIRSQETIRHVYNDDVNAHEVKFTSQVMSSDKIDDTYVILPPGEFPCKTFSVYPTNVTYWFDTTTCTIRPGVTGEIHYTKYAYSVTVFGKTYTIGYNFHIKPGGTTAGVNLNDPANGDIRFFKQNSKTK